MYSTCKQPPQKITKQNIFPLTKQILLLKENQENLEHFMQYCFVYIREGMTVEEEIYLKQTPFY